MNDFIFLQPQSLSNDMCDEIIELFSKEGDNIVEGAVASGVRKSIKNTTDFVIPIVVPENSHWHRINTILSDEIYRNLDIYIANNIEKYGQSLLPEKYVFEDAFMIQRYKQNDGRYIYHDDSRITFKLCKYRVITFIWYLNDVIEGGETEFFGSYKITPKKGSLLFFPAGWCYPHCGKMPLSSDKYIITGWLYVNCKSEKV